MAIVVKQKKDRVIRFRLTEDEWETIRMAAATDHFHINTELEKHGLAGSDTETLNNPAEWTRRIVLLTAEKKLKAFGLKTPRERRQDNEPITD